MGIPTSRLRPRGHAGSKSISIENNEETNEAASKLQAIYRSRKARDRVEVKRMGVELGIEDNAETNSAASKLQSVHRARKARRRARMKRLGIEDTPESNRAAAKLQAIHRFDCMRYNTH